MSFNPVRFDIGEYNVPVHDANDAASGANYIAPLRLLDVDILPNTVVDARPKRAAALPANLTAITGLSVASLNINPCPAREYGVIGRQVREVFMYGYDHVFSSFSSSPQLLSCTQAVARRSWRLFCQYRLLCVDGLSVMVDIDSTEAAYLVRAPIRVLATFQTPLTAANPMPFVNIRQLQQHLLAYKNLISNQGTAFNAIQLSGHTRFLFDVLSEVGDLEVSCHESNFTAKIYLNIFNHLLYEYSGFTMSSQLELSFHLIDAHSNYDAYRPIDLVIGLRKQIGINHVNISDPALLTVGLLEVSRYLVQPGVYHKDYEKLLQASLIVLARQYYYLRRRGAPVEDLQQLRIWAMFAGSTTLTIMLLFVNVSKVTSVPDFCCVNFADVNIFIPSLSHATARNMDDFVRVAVHSYGQYHILSSQMAEQGRLLLSFYSKYTQLNRPTTASLTPAPKTNDSSSAQSRFSHNSNTPLQSKSKVSKKRSSKPAKTAPKKKNKTVKSTKNKVKPSIVAAKVFIKELEMKCGIEWIEDMCSDVPSNVLAMIRGRFHDELHEFDVVVKVKWINGTRSKKLIKGPLSLPCLRTHVVKHHFVSCTDIESSPCLVTIEDWLITVEEAFEFVRDEERDFICLSLCIDMWTALAALHELRLLHRDIKDTNIMFQQRTRTFVLIDFDNMIQCDEDDDFCFPCKQGTFGTKGFDAPELILHDPCIYTPASDVYSMSVALTKILGAQYCSIQSLMDAVSLPLTFDGHHCGDRPSAQTVLESVRQLLTGRYNDVDKSIKSLLDSIA